jgi:hypothetical protein
VFILHAIKEGEILPREAVRTHEGRHTRRVGLQSEHHQVEHELHVLVLAHRDARRRPFQVRRRQRRPLGRRRIHRALDLLLHTAHAFEILVDLLLIATAGDLLQRLRILQNEIHHAAAILRRPPSLRRRRIAKKTIKSRTRTDLRRNALRGTAPRNRVRQRDRIVPRHPLTRRLGAELDARKTCALANLPRDHLIHRNAIHAVLDGRAGQKRPRELHMPFAHAVDPAQHDHVVLKLRQRLQNRRQRKIPALARHIPSLRKHPVWLEKGHETAWRQFLSRASLRRHDFKPWQSQRGSDSTKKSAAFNTV